MTVVVDKPFFEAMGPMHAVRDISNCDIAWFVVDYVENEEVSVIRQSRMVLTTLERAVEGLTAGRPVSRERFEERIRQALLSHT